MSVQRKRIRVAESLAQSRRFEDEFRTWLDRRRRRDARRQYDTQLTSLDTILTGALEQVRAELTAGSVDAPLSAVYARTRAFEQRVLLLRRLWAHYRDKFDQRDDRGLERVLASADEIVWSCYAGTFRVTGGVAGVSDQPTAPLPYIEASYSPQARPRFDVPNDLQQEFFRKLLPRMPIPLVSMPPSCVARPWWLIFLAHEVGHHVQYDLLPEMELLPKFREVLSSAVRPGADPVGDPVAERWQGWGEEIFADTFSVLNVGAWAGWGLVELVLADDARMIRRSERYPAPVVRLALLAEIANRLGLDRRRVCRGLDPVALVEAAGDSPHAERAVEDLSLVPPVAEAVLSTPLEPLGDLREVCDWRGKEFAGRDDGGAGDVDGWSSALRGESGLYARKNIRAARLVIAGALAAWSSIAEIAEDDRREARAADLAENVLNTVPGCAEPGTRSATAPPKTDLAALGDEAAGLLLEIDDERLNA